MANFLLLLQTEVDVSGVGLGEYPFAAVPRVGEYVLRIVHKELDKDEALVETEDITEDDMHRRIYRVDAVVHFTEPIIRRDGIPALDGYLIVRSERSSRSFNRKRHRNFFGRTN